MLSLALSNWTMLSPKDFAKPNRSFIVRVWPFLVKEKERERERERREERERKRERWCVREKQREIEKQSERVRVSEKGGGVVSIG